MDRDSDGQPFDQGLHWKSNQRKAMYSLLGICEGLLADQVITADEVAFLDAWLKDNNQLRRDPDYLDLVDVVKDVLEDGVVTQSELDDVESQIRTMLEYRDKEAFANERGEMEFLLGFLNGLVADRMLNEYEILALRGWLRTTLLDLDTWPISVLAKRIRKIVADRIIEDAEAADLQETVSDIVGRGMDFGVPSGMTTAFGLDNVDAIEFAGKSFCITGKLASGPRTQCVSAIESKGGIVKNSVTKKLDYLVVGTLASRDWAQSAYGTKIEKAMQVKDSGGHVIVLSEELLFRFLG